MYGAFGKNSSQSAPSASRTAAVPAPAIVNGHGEDERDPGEEEVPDQPDELRVAALGAADQDERDAEQRNGDEAEQCDEASPARVHASASSACRSSGSEYISPGHSSRGRSR